jgi:hypothetical protein
VKRLFLLVLVAMVIILPVKTTSGGVNIQDVNIDPNRPTDKDSITIVVSGSGSTMPAWMDGSDFRMAATSLELDIFVSLGPFEEISEWSHSEIIGTLPAGSYDLTVQAYNYNYVDKEYVLNDINSISFMVMIEADVEIEPKTLNLQGKGEWLNCNIRLGEDCNVADIEPNSVVLESEPNDIYAEWIWFNEKQNIVMAKFNRSEVLQVLDDEDIIEIGEAELTVSGELENGMVFVGTDVINVIDKGRGRR